MHTPPPPSTLCHRNNEDDEDALGTNKDTKITQAQTQQTDRRRASSEMRMNVCVCAHKHNDFIHRPKTKTKDVCTCVCVEKRVPLAWQAFVLSARMVCEQEREQVCECVCVLLSHMEWQTLDACLAAYSCSDFSVHLFCAAPSICPLVYLLRQFADAPPSEA